jgi:hypothetical protein
MLVRQIKKTTKREKDAFSIQLFTNNTNFFSYTPTPIPTPSHPHPHDMSFSSILTLNKNLIAGQETIF